MTKESQDSESSTPFAPIVKRGLLKLKGNKTVTDIVKTLKSQQELLKKNSVEEALPREYLQFKKKAAEEEKRKGLIKLMSEQQVTSEIAKTPSQEAYELLQKQRFNERVEQELKVTHRQKLEKFNNKLSSLPEHFDIPKVGPG